VWRGGDQANSEHCIGHAGTLNCDKGQQGGIVTTPVAFKQNMSTPDAAVGLRPTLQAENFHAVAFAQNQREEVRELGDCATALQVQGTHQQTFVATPFDTTQITSKANYSSPRPNDPCHPLAAGAHPPAVAYDVHGTLAKKGASETDIHSALRGRTPGQSEASTTTVVAFAQNQLGEVRTNREVMGTVNTNQNASGRNTPMVAVPQGFTHSGYSNQPAWMTGDRTDCLPASGHGDTSNQGIGLVVGCDDTAGTIRSNTRNNSSPKTEAAMHVMHGMAVRRLTPKECERLQGFPDGYTDVTYRKKPAADGPRYKALGNSMAVPVMAWIGRRIAELEATDGR
jgi:site-specific DNA-cytosine methylase